MEMNQKTTGYVLAIGIVLTVVAGILFFYLETYLPKTLEAKTSK